MKQLTGLFFHLFVLLFLGGKVENGLFFLLPFGRQPWIHLPLFFFLIIIIVVVLIISLSLLHATSIPNNINSGLVTRIMRIIAVTGISLLPASHISIVV